jgi:hypothetical protein
MTGIVAQFKDHPELLQFLRRWGPPLGMAVLVAADVATDRATWRTYVCAMLAVQFAWQAVKSMRDARQGKDECQ